jgi:hypothetical protein
LPVPRRVPRDVPEVQLLVLEELDRLVAYCFGFAWNKLLT